MKKINLYRWSILALISIIVLFVALALGGRKKTPPPVSKNQCSTLQGAENLALSKKQIIGVPIRRAPDRGFSSIIILTTEDKLSTSLLIRDQEQWRATKKNQVVVWEGINESNGVLDFSPNLLITSDGEELEKIEAKSLLLVIKIPLNQLENIEIQPKLDPSFTQIGQFISYPAQANINGLDSPFQVLTLPITPNFVIPNAFSKSLDRIGSGNIIYPNLLGQELTIAGEVEIGDVERCLQKSTNKVVEETSLK